MDHRAPLYGRNAVGGAINILYKQPSHDFDYAVKGIVGNFGTAETYGMINGSLIEDKLSARVNFSTRDRDGVIEEIGPGSDLDGLGTRNVAAQFRFTPTETLSFDVRFNKMEIDRDFGGANGGGLVVLDEEGQGFRNHHGCGALAIEAIDTANTDPANFGQNSWYDASRPILNFVDPAYWRKRAGTA